MFSSARIKAIVFDLDGTLYIKDLEYVKDKGCIKDAHFYLNYQAWIEMSSGRDPYEVAQSLRKRYAMDAQIPGKVVSVVAGIPKDKISAYKALVKKHGSNGKVFANEFSLPGSFLHTELIQHVSHDQILAPSQSVTQVIGQCKSKFDIGIMTSETIITVEKIMVGLNLSISDFTMDTGDEYKVFCNNNIESKKPSPEGFVKSYESFGLNPEEVVYVGDVFEKDIVPALQLGMQAVHVVQDDDVISGIRPSDFGEYLEVARLEDMLKFI